MDSGLVGGGIVITLAAVLWLAYLIPGWIARREYQSTERNVVRLQQSMRILAETDDVPEEVRWEASTRRATEIEKLARQRQRQSRRVARERLRSLRTSNRRSEDIMTSPTDRAELLARRRRGRAVASLVAIIGLVCAGGGIGALLIAGSWLLLTMGVVFIGGAAAVLVRLNRPLPTQAAPRAAAPSAPLFDYSSDPAVQAEQAAARRWMPQPLPKPLHLSEGTAAAGAMASVDAAAQMRHAVERAKMELRAAERSPSSAPVAKIDRERAQQGTSAEQPSPSTAQTESARARADAAPTPRTAATPAESQRTAEPSAQATAGSAAAGPAAGPGEGQTSQKQPASSGHDPRLAAMGVVGEQDTALDVNEVLRRRRVV